MTVIHQPKNNQFWVLVVGIFTLSLMLFCAVAVVIIYLFAPDQETGIASGVTIAGLEVGGQPETNLPPVLEQLSQTRQITLVDGDRRWTLPLSQLGITIEINSTLQALENAKPNTAVEPRYLVDLNQTQTGLFTLSQQTNIAATVGNPGRAMEIPVMLDRLRVDLTGEIADDLLELSMVQVAAPAQDVLVSNPSGATTTHIVEAGQELGLIAREYGVSVDDIVQINNLADPNVLLIGQELIIPAGSVYEPTQADAPIPSTTVGKAIVVSTGEQRIYAYEDGKLVHSHLTSTGLPDTPTVLGDYKIYVKYRADDMSGPGYFLPQVPFTMYFYQGYGIHGTYWHNSFGRPMSHGCVNLPTEEAEWFFNWAEVGTPVRVI